MRRMFGFFGIVFITVLFGLVSLATAAENRRNVNPRGRLLTAQEAAPSAQQGLWLVQTDGRVNIIDIARQNQAVYYVQCSDAAKRRALRESAEAAGLLGRRIFVDEEDGLVPLAAGVADVVAKDAEQGFRAWDIRYQPSDEVWSHPYHAPDNNPLSLDPAVKAPYLTQFLAEPLFSCQPEVTVIAGGRIFKAFGHMAFREYQNVGINTLFCLSASNGMMLWKRPLHEGFMIHRNTMIATDDTLYLGDDESCKLIDAATGQVKDQITITDGADGPVWKWMAIDNGVLYALVGATEVKAPVAKGTGTAITGWPWAMWPGYDYADSKSAWGFGRNFIAMDLKTKKLLWNHFQQLPVDARGVCMKGGRIYYYCPDRLLACIDAKTGDFIWQTGDAALLDAIGPNEKAQHYVTGFATSCYMKCTDKVLTFAGPQRRSLVAISTDGKLLWQRKGGNFQLVLRPEGIYALGDQIANKSYKFDYMTGRILAEFRGRRACTRATGSFDSVFCRAIEGTTRWDVATDSTQHIAPMRPACHDGVIVADGRLYWGPWICGCHLTLYGAICLTPAGNFQFDAKSDQNSQLKTLKSDPSDVPALQAAATDWPAFQANNRRTSITSAQVAKDAKPQWTFAQSTGVIPTAPIVAGGLVFIAADNGTVHAIDAASGNLKWKAYTGASIYFPPALANGRLYVGSNDGNVYAYEAATGAPLWRFRCSPVERKIPVYGEIMSTWPVAGGVLVQDGTVYAAAGISHFDGTRVYALDAVTGKIKWENDSSGIVDPEVKNGISVTGALRLEGNQLSFPGGNVYATAIYDASTGKCLNTPAGPRTVRRNVLFPRKVWDPLEGDQHATAAGTIRIGPLRGRFHPVALIGTDPQKPLWTTQISTYNGSAIAGDTLLILGNLKATENDAPAPSRVTAINIKDGSTLWSHPLPATPVHHGLAVDASGRVVVAMEDGRVMCVR